MMPLVSSEKSVATISAGVGLGCELKVSMTRNLGKITMRMLRIHYVNITSLLNLFLVGDIRRPIITAR